MNLQEQIMQTMSSELSKQIDREILVEVTRNWPDSLYTVKMSGRAIDLPHGWAGELAYPNTTDFDDHWDMYLDMVNHINTYVKDPTQNAFWNKVGDCVYVMFRKEKDMNWFILKYGA